MSASILQYVAMRMPVQQARALAGDVLVDTPTYTESQTSFAYRTSHINLGANIQAHAHANAPVPAACGLPHAAHVLASVPVR
eukprot:6200316-Pleurochrysis_carterae.AAC.2